MERKSKYVQIGTLVQRWVIGDGLYHLFTVHRLYLELVQCEETLQTRF